MYLKYYLEQLNYQNIPSFLIKYLKSPSLLRLRNVGYFCGMDYASKDIYNFSEYISRYDHSLTVSLIVYKLTNNMKMALAALFHDIATPCFSHVIDYMNEDYEKQESTEEYTGYILRNDSYLIKCLKEENIDIDDVIDFKKYTIVDNDRPKVCADRIDGVILTGFGWVKNVSKSDIRRIIQDMCVFKNEFNEDEIGFKSYDIAKNVLEVSESIDIYCHSKEDNYIMQLLAKLTKLAISKGLITYEELYSYDERELFELLKDIKDKELMLLLNEFQNKKKDDIPDIDLPKVKVRSLTSLVNGKRLV